MDLSIKEQKILCSLKLKENKDARALHKELAHNLLTHFDKGREGITRTEAAKYRKMVGLPPIGPLPKFRTKTLHTIEEWYAMIRNLLVGFNGVAKNFNVQIFKKLLSVGGLYHGGVLVFEFLIAMIESLRATDKEVEKKLSHFARFKYALSKGNRPNRMTTAAMWFTINFFGFIFTGGWFAWVNLFGFTVDIAREIYNSWFDFSDHRKLLNKFSDERIAAENKLKDLDDLKDSNVKEQRKSELTREISELKFIEKKLADNVEEVRNNRIYNVTIASLIFVSGALALFPPTSGFGAALFVATLSLVCENVLEGIGRKLYGMYCKRKKHAAQHKNAIAETSVLTPSEKKPIQGSYVTQCSSLLTQKEAPQELKSEELNSEQKEIKTITPQTASKPTINYDWMHQASPKEEEEMEKELVTLNPKVA